MIALAAHCTTAGRLTATTVETVRFERPLFGRVVGGHAPWLDRGLPLLSRPANHSGLWIVIAACLAAT